MKKIMIVIFGFLIVFCGFVLVKNSGYNNEKSGDKIMTLGLNKGQESIFRGQLGRAARNVEIVEEGRKLLDGRKSEEAISYFKKAIIDIDDASVRALAENGLVDAYEMNRDYDKAYYELNKIVKTYVVDPTDMVRMPDEERLKYLKYAIEGEYDLAVKHAELALKTDAKLPNSPSRFPNSPYEKRLKDLKASKEYIESLKVNKREK